MNGAALARDLLIEATDCALAMSPDEVADAHEGWPMASERLADIGAKMRRHRGEAGDAMWAKCEALGLASPSRWLLYLCAAVELYPEAAAAASILAEDERLHLLTPITHARLMRAALGEPFPEALSEAMPGCAVERLGLIERVPGAGRPASQHALRLTTPGTALLSGRGVSLPIPETASVQIEPPAVETAFRAELVQGVIDLLELERIVCVSSRSARAGRQLGFDAASLRGEPAIFVEPAPDGPPHPTWIGGLRGGLVVLDAFPLAQEGRSIEPLLRRIAVDLPGLVAVVPENAMTGSLRTVEVDRIGFDERRRIWSMAIGNGAAPELAARFAVSLPEARDAVRGSVRTDERHDQDSREMTEIAAAVCSQGARRMGRLVTRLRPRARLEDLVAPDDLLRSLQDIIDAHRTRARVYGEWGMGNDSELGRGLACLFSVPPGTGKTFAAQCIAAELSLNLYRIDLSQMVSKYIGETEKALARVFDEAESGHGILLFDEADALFGKRSEVKDAHDRYANIEIDYLLQRMEAHDDGISILTTNLEENIDRAFYRRLSFILRFPIPSVDLRRRLWERYLPPPKLRPAGLDLEPYVQRYALAGANIRNIGIAAAHMAAAAPEGVVTADHLLRATFRELEKAGLARSREDFDRLAGLLGGRG